jgi:hypothetical protein
MLLPHSTVEALESRIAPAGLITATFSGGSLVIDGDAEANNLTITQIAPDALSLSSSSGNIQLDLPGNSDPAPASTIVVKDFTGSLTIRLGGGNDVLNIADFYAPKKVTIDLGGGSNGLVLADIHASGKMEILGGDGGNDIAIQSLRTSGPVNVRLGGGMDTVALGTLAAKSASFTLGAGDDSLLINGALVRGALTVDGGAGANGVTLGDGSAIDVGGKISVVYGDDAFVDATKFMGSLTRFGSLVIENGNATALTQIISPLLEGGSIKIVNGGSGGTILLNSAFTSMKSLKVIGGAGNDSLEVNPLVNLNITGSLVFKGGDGNDTVAVVSNGRIGGKVTLEMGASASIQGVNILGLQILSVGSISVTSQAATQNVVLLSRVDVKGSVQGNLSGSPSQFTIVDSSIKGAFKATLSDAVDLMNVVNSRFGGAVSIQTLGGADEVNIYGNSSVGTLFKKAVKVNLGEGDDILRVGSATPAEAVVFRKKVTFDGGGGADTAELRVSAIFPTGQLRLVRFNPI